MHRLLCSRRLFAAGAFALLLLSTVHGAEPMGRVNSQEPAREADDSGLRSILPSPFQRNPRLVFTAMTEFTAEGRQWRKVASDAPALIVAHSLGAKNKGEIIDEKMLEREEIEPLLVKALAKNGFLIAGEGQKPEIAVVYMWGLHKAYDPETSAVDENAYVRNILDRAALVGGKKFAAELAKAYRDTEDIAMSAPRTTGALPEHLEGANIGIQRGMAQMNAAMSPLKLFAMRGDKHQALLDQAANDCYFIVASAYDHDSMADNTAILLWRTRLTVSTRGASQKQSLPALLSASAPYFGRETPDAEIMKGRVVPTGRVEIGTPTTVP